MSQSLLVTGASGHFGQAVLNHLLDTLKVPADRIIATTRKPESLAAFAVRGVTVREADFEGPAEALAKAFAGAQRLLLISTDALDRPGRRLAQHQAAIQATEAAGVQHVIYTSMPQPENSPLLIAPDHDGSEKALAASALPGWTVLRNNWYFENLLMGLHPALASGHWYTAAGEGRVAHIARDDLARAAATVLAGTTAGRETVTLSGAVAYTAEELVQQLSQAVGRPIQVVHVPVAGLQQGMVAAGIPEPLAAVFASFDANTAAGRVAQVTGDYQRITGRAPQSLSEWLAANRAALPAV